MRTKCSRCGIGYRGLRVGDVCGDRSGAIRQAVRDGVDIETVVLTPCRGLLVRIEDWNLDRRRADLANDINTGEKYERHRERSPSP
jgi:hypothetical protein